MVKFGVAFFKFHIRKYFCKIIFYYRFFTHKTVKSSIDCKIMNVINTIADKEDVGITIESKSIDNTELGITDVATQNTMLVVFVIIIPIAILVAGFVFWLRRRNR